MNINSAITIVLLLLVSQQCFSQIKFENGYFIDNNNNRTNCLIKNIDWDDNPSKFNYRLTEDGESKTANIEEIREFGIDNEIKFLREKVQIDKSSDLAAKLTENRNPEFVEETVFLKLEIEGEINLYSYKSGNLRRYFFKEKDSEIQQLVYKRYLVDYSKIAQNNAYRQQLAIRLKCNSISEKDIKKVSYKVESLKDIFIQYNNCNSKQSIEVKKSKGDINLSIKPGIIFSNLSKSTITYADTTFEYENSTNFRIGAELEYILPFNKNKWGVFLEAAFWNNKSEIQVESDNVSGGILKVNYRNSTIELPLGIRHYLFLNERSKIYFSLSHEFYFLNSKKEYLRNDNSTLYSYEDSGFSVGNLGIGTGFKYNDRFLIEAKLIRFIGLNTLNFKYTTYTISVGYSLF